MLVLTLTTDEADEACIFSGVSTPSCRKDLTVMKVVQGYKNALGMLNTWWVQRIPKYLFHNRCVTSFYSTL